VVTEEAAHAGQLVDGYVAEAVATRLMVDLTRRNAESADLLTRLSEVHIRVPALMDAPRVKVYDRIADMAADALAAPGAAVSLVDRGSQEP